MGRKPKYNSETEKKAALALAKKLKRLSKKNRNKLKKQIANGFLSICQRLLIKLLQRLKDE